MVKKTPDESAAPSKREQTPTPVDPKDRAAETIVQPSDTAKHVSDVVLADTAKPKEMSDVVLVESGTLRAPSFREPSPPISAPPPAAPTIELRRDEDRADRDQTPMALLPGAKVDDFEIVRLLGRGAFGHVYLARQVSLDRLVALKISANRGSEGRTMARLEHQHIVQVFSEKVDPDLNQRLLCMQLVPGIGLDKLISMLHAKESRIARQSADWTGAEMIGFIDSSGSMPTALDPAALHDREALGDMDAVEVTAWFGARLGEALDFAHKNGVLHRDIKPANILVNPYGRPMLADFNISSQPVGSEASGEEMFGGTFAYMSPEHLDAFNPGDDTGHEAVTARSDLYSLGLVLQQLLEGRISFPLFNKRGNMIDTLKKMANDRRQGAPPCRKGLPRARMTLERTIGRCLEPDPEDRFASGAELAEQLDGCRQLREAQRQLPLVPRVFGRILRRPFIWLVILVVLPQLAASAVNIAYNMTQIVSVLDGPQKEKFYQVLFIYNLFAYPIGIPLCVFGVWSIARCWKSLSDAERVSEAEVKLARRRALRLPLLIAGLTAYGWFPGGFIFPLVIWMTTGLELSLACHFVASFVLSGMIALAYSLCGVEFIVLRGLYPGLWRDARHFTAVTRDELAPVQLHLTLIQWLAYAIPLVAAIFMLLLISDLNFTFTFRLLVVALIVLGIWGLIVAGAVTRHLSRVIVALTKPKG